MGHKCLPFGDDGERPARVVPDHYKPFGTASGGAVEKPATKSNKLSVKKLNPWHLRSDRVVPARQSVLSSASPEVQESFEPGAIRG